MAELGNWLVDSAWLWTTLGGVALAVVVFVLATVGSDWAPILVMATAPVQRVLLAGPDELKVTLTQLALAAFFAGTAIRFANGQLQLKVDAVTILVGVLISIFGFSVVVSADLELWAAESYRWAV